MLKVYTAQIQAKNAMWNVWRQASMQAKKEANRIDMSTAAWYVVGANWKMPKLATNASDTAARFYYAGYQLLAYEPNP